MVTKPDRLSEAACCVISAVKTVLERHGIPIPERQAISHKGLDDECADCSGIFVSSPSSTSAEVVNPDGKCVKVRQFRFQIDVLRKVCTEAIDPCGDQYGGCDETVDNPLPDGPDLDEPCCKPPPFRLPPELCEEPTGEPYTVNGRNRVFLARAVCPREGAVPRNQVLLGALPSDLLPRDRPRGGVRGDPRRLSLPDTVAGPDLLNYHADL